MMRKSPFLCAIILLVATMMLCSCTKHQVAPGYNPYGIPGSEDFAIHNADGTLKENYKDLIKDIKKKYAIPEEVTGIPWDENAKKRLLDEDGNLVAGWETILAQIKREWGAQ